MTSLIENTVCSTIPTLLNVQGIIVALSMSGIWIILGLTRCIHLKKISRQDQQQTSHSSASSSSPIDTVTQLEHPISQIEWPSVSVILPCKGTSTNSISNWKSQLSTSYAGDIEFIFVVESTEDPAHAPILAVLQEHDSNPTNRRERPASLIVAGITFHNSQKISNQLVGLENASHDYVLYLDDDIRLHRSTIQDLVKPLLFNNTVTDDDSSSSSVPTPPAPVMVSSGYSVEVPRSDSPFADYLIMVYRSINWAGFISKQPSFCWGGCFMARADELRRSVGDIWQDGGYSDDMLLGNLARNAGRKLSAPYSVVFPNLLPPGHTFGHSYANFVRRQYYVLTTYAGQRDRAQNAAALWVMIAAGVVVGLPIISLLLQLVPLVCHTIITLLSSGSWDMMNMRVSGCGSNVLGAAVLLGSLFVCAAAHSFMVTRLVLLCNALSPEKEPIRPRLRILPTALALLVHCALMPLLSLSVLLTPRITWHGLTYTRDRGRIVSVSRPDCREVGNDESMLQSLRNGCGFEPAQVVKRTGNMITQRAFTSGEGLDG